MVHPPSHIRRRARHAGTAAGTRQHGAVSIMFTVLLLPLIGICGLAIDLAMVYTRQTEMRNLAHAVALVAAKKLNGTSSGVADAVTEAAATAAAYTYRNGMSGIAWTPAALQFGTTPVRSGTWMDAGAAAGAAQRIYYVKVSTSALEGAGDVSTALMSLIFPALATVSVNDAVVAGRTEIDVAPLGICAMSTAAAASRTNAASYVELVEYGFRRGISYDLMNLNPSGTTPLNFAINPVAFPGTTGSAADLLPDNLAPHACTGALSIPRVTGDPIAVGRPFPLASLYQQLNSRFDQYGTATCTANAGVPDFNIKAYYYTSMPSPIPWMTTAPSGQTAAASTASGKLQTIADLMPPTGTAAQYGPLWAYAKAVPYSAYVAGSIEPASGYTTFTPAAWPTLYGGQTVKTYPTATSTPYKPGAGVNTAAPSGPHAPGMRNRRVLNVPLLDCSTVPSSSANVLAIGKFFMTVPATPTVLAAEFAGIAPLQRIDGTIEVFP